MSAPPSPLLVAASILFVCVSPAAAQNGDWRTIEFETTEVTSADVALSPDGKWLIFTMLGHLFRLPIEGGTGEQLTFGPYYDSDPAISPEGARVAFVSDRDGSEGNIFVLDLATGEVTQVTHESSAGRPAWSPDGRAIAYLSFVGEARDSPQPWKIGPPLPTVPAVIRRVDPTGGEPETLSDGPRLFRSVFYLPDGRLAWSVIERQAESASDSWDFFPDAITRIENLKLGGVASTLRTLPGYADPISPSPADDGFYCRRSPRFWASRLPYPEDLLFIPIPGGEEKRIATLTRNRGWTPRFAVARDNGSIYLGEAGRLWRIALPGGNREPIGFRARVRLEIRDAVAPPRWAPAAILSSAPPRTLMYPTLSPDGRTLVFGAAGYLWQQPADGVREAQRLFEGNAFERDPAFSPVGRWLAFVRREHSVDELVLFDFENGETRTLASGWVAQPSWSVDGQRLVLADWKDAARVVVVSINEGRTEELAEVDAMWPPRPHFSEDGEALFYSSTRHPQHSPGPYGALYRLQLDGDADPAVLLQFRRYFRDARVSPDRKWVALRRNVEIWVAPLGSDGVSEEHLRRLSAAGGEAFAFTPDGSAVVYSAGQRMWRHPLAGGEPKEIPVRLELARATPPPLLVQRVRLLDFAAGGFSDETSMFIEQGRLRWIGAEEEHSLPLETVTLDAGGGFAIPGLFDMHAHVRDPIASRDPAEWIAYGVTSVRSMGALEWQQALIDRSESSGGPLPRYFYSGEVLSLSLIDRADDGRSYARHGKERGAGFIKIYNTISWPLMRAVAEEARRLRLPVAGHGTNLQEIVKSVNVGFASLEHVAGPARSYGDVLQMLAAAGTRWDPTLGASAYGNALLFRDEPERLLDSPGITPALEAVDTEGLRAYWIEQLAGVREAHRRGVKLLLGTDRPSKLQLHWELEYLVQAGIPPLDVLRIATHEGAAAVGADEHVGTLEVGKLADIVLLDANPLEDIKNTQRIWRVIKGGWVFDPAELRASASTDGEK